MIYYELKIESDEDTIEITKESMIFFAQVSFDTINNDTQKKSNAILTRMVVKGKIDESINDSLLKISEWARDLNDSTTYRKVTLTIKKDAAGKILRTYEVPAMFVCDYNESYGAPDDDDESSFELKLTQGENRLKDFNTY